MNQLPIFFRYIGKKSFIWLALGLASGLCLAFVETLISGYILIILKGIGMTTQKVELPLSIKLESQSIVGGLVFLIALGFLRSFLNTCAGLSAVISNEYFQSKLKIIYIKSTLNSLEGFSSLSKLTTMFSETIGKAALFFHSCAHMIPLSIQALFIFFVLLKMSFMYTFMGMTFLGISGVVIVILQKIIQRAVCQMPDINVRINQSVNRIYRNWFLIKILKIEKEEYERFGNLLVDYSTKNIYSSLLALIASNLPNAFGIVLISAFIYSHQITPVLSAGLFVAYLYLFLRFVQTLSQLANFLGIANINFPYFKLTWLFYLKLKNPQQFTYSEELSSILFIKSSSRIIRTSILNKKQDEGDLSPNISTFAPSLNIRELWFSHCDRTEGDFETASWIFENFSLTIEAGEHVAIMGPSGVGKSTLLALLMGVITPNKGSVKVNGLNPAVFLASNAESIAYVGADPFLIEGSIEQNLAYGNARKIDKLEIENVFFQLGLDNWFKEINCDLSFEINDSATTLSTGQKQRLALARALLRKPSLLILDEVSSNLDLETESKIAEAILKLKFKTTVVMVTHRMGITKYSDKIINLNHASLGVR